MKNDFYEDLKKYFENTSDEQIEKDWNETIDFDNVSLLEYKQILQQTILNKNLL